MASKAQDVVDIFKETWIAPTNIPLIVLETRDKKPSSYFARVPKDGVIVVKKKYEDDYEDLGGKYENLVWTFKVVIIATTDAKLELMIRQGKEVLDRYSNIPFTTETNENIYSYAGLMNGETVEELNSWTYDAYVQLANFLSEKVIA